MAKKENNEQKNMTVTLTGIEREIADGETLISTTDLKGRITYANRPFWQIAGYNSESEMLGQPHNIVRHPLMPRSAFEDLWNSLKDGRPWSGVVVNRSINGDHYWVDANVAPVIERGTVIGYISVRRKPTTAQKKFAEDTYRSVLAGNSRLHPSDRKKISVRTKVLTFFGGIALCNLGLGAYVFHSTGALWVAVSITCLALVSIAAGLWLTNYILHPIKEATEIAKLIGANDLSQRIQHDRNDELGQLHRSLLGTLVMIAGTIGRIQENSQILKGSAVGLLQASQSLSAGSEQSSSQAETISAAANEMNQSLQTISGAVEEMSTSIAEVAKQASNAAKVAKSANETALSTDSTVKELGVNANEIGKVIQTIVGIADQTKMLALNAAIEAAGAGEAGKGFAVVATEVKELARQTAESSEEIKEKIRQIQQSSIKSVEAIDKIVTVINEVSQISTTIAAAVEEQAITTKEIAGNIAQTSTASSEVAQNISGISTAAKSSAADAEETSKQAGSIEVSSKTLSMIVERVRI